MYKDFLLVEPAGDFVDERYIMEAPAWSSIRPGEIVRDENGDMMNVLQSITLNPQEDILKFILGTGIEHNGKAISIVKDSALNYKEEKDEPERSDS